MDKEYNGKIVSEEKLWLVIFCGKKIYNGQIVVEEKFSKTLISG